MTILALVAAILGAVLLPAFAAVPELPRAYVDTTYAPPAGSTIAVGSGGNLQAAINAALPGDTIVLQAGAVFRGPFTLPDKGASNQWIYIQSSALASLPAPGNRVSPADAANMPAIVGTGTPVVALQTLARAHHYRFVGIEFRTDSGVFTTGLVRVGSSAESSLAEQPNHIVFDRCYIHGDPAVGGRRGIVLNGASSAVVDSYLSDWKEAGGDSQAVAGWNGPGPFRIVNNHLEAAAENVMFGGADPSIAGLTPADIEIRGNRFTKQVAWRPMAWTVKNLLELKNARRILVEGNVFEYDWEAAQSFAINIKSSNQDGTAPWSVTSDFTFRHNIVVHGPSAIKFCGRACDGAPTAQGRAFLVQNNLFHDIRSAAWGGAGVFLQTIQVTPDLTVNHNTVIHDGATFNGGDEGAGGNTGFQFTDNIAQRGAFGFRGTSAGEGIDTLETYFPGSVFARNALAGASAGVYPADNYFPAAFANLGFADLALGDYRLAAGSPYRNAASDGRDIGADIDAVNAATACALNGQCGPARFPVASVNPFSFVDQSGIEPGALVTSNAVTISGTGLTLPVTISISGGGAYSIGCNQRLTTTTALIRAGEAVCVRYRTPPTPSTTTTTTLTVNGVSATFRSTTGALTAPSTANHTGLWWNPAESGWGVNFAHQGDLMFGTLFTYDASHRPMWLVMPDGRLQMIAIDDLGAGLADLGTYSGPLYRTTGPPFNAVPFNPIGPGNLAQVGERRASFGTNATTLDYTVDGVRVTKSIAKQVYGSRAADCRATAASRAGVTNLQDLWWNPSESGWGLNLTHQDDTLFATLFTYGADGAGLWLVMSEGRRQADGSYLGDLYRTSGPVFNAQPFTPVAAADVRRVGTMRVRIINGETATLEYSVDNVGVTKSITRQVFGSPVVQCAS